MKTNLGLVEYCKAQLGRPYWFRHVSGIKLVKVC